MRQFRYLTGCLLVATFVLAPAASARSRKGDKLLKEGIAAEQSKDYEKALQLYLDAAKTDPGDAAYQASAQRVRFQAGQARVDAGQKLRNDGKLEEALAEFQKAYALDPASPIAIQEVRRTTQMIERQKKGQQGEKPEDKGATPADRGRKESEERVSSLMGVPELKPVSRQITSLKMNSQPPKVLFETVGKLAGVNVIFDPDYQSPAGKNFSIDLTNTTLEEALEYISTLTKSFWKPLSANAIFITNDNVGKRRDYEDHVVKVFYLRNITTVQELQEVATNIRSITDIRRVFTSNALSAVVVRGSVDQVALAEKIVNDLDKPKPEVIVDVIVMEASSAKTRDLAATLISAGTMGLKIPISSTPRSSLSTTIPSTGTPSTGTPAASTGSGISISSLGKLNFSDYSLTLPGGLVQAMMTDRTTRVLQTPQMRVLNGMKGSLKIGDRYPYATGSFAPGIGAVGGVSPLVSTQFQFAEVGVNVDLTPNVNGADDITLHVELDVSSVKDRIDVGGLSQPIIGQRKIITDIRLKEGEASLLGGLMQTQDTKSSAGVPGLGNIPILRWLFSNDSREKDRGDLIIALVPHIVRTQEINDVNMRGIAAGNDQQVKLLYSHREAAPAATPGQAKPEAPAAPAPPPAAEQPKPEQPKPEETKPAAPSGALTISFAPPMIDAAPGSNFAVAVQADNVTDLFSAPMKIKFDPKFLHIVAVKPGTLLGGDGKRIVFSENTLNDAGESSILLNRVPGAGGVSGSGALVVITFQAVAPGTTKVAVTDLTLRASTLQTIAAPMPVLTVNVK